MAQEALGEANFCMVLFFFFFFFCTEKVFKLPGLLFQTFLKLYNLRYVQPSSLLGTSLCYTSSATEALTCSVLLKHLALGGWRVQGDKRKPAAISQHSVHNAHKGTSPSAAWRQRGDCCLALEAPNPKRKNSNGTTVHLCKQGRLLWRPIKLS